MSTTFDDRKNAFESKFAQDQQLQFRVEARACKLFGLWLAEQMGLTDAAATGYASELVAANLDQPGLDDVIEKAVADLTTKGKAIDEPALRARLDECFIQSKEQVMTETSA